MSRAFKERDYSGHVKMQVVAIGLCPNPMRCVCLGSQAFRRMRLKWLPGFRLIARRGKKLEGKKECPEILFKH